MTYKHLPTSRCRFIVDPTLVETLFSSTLLRGDGGSAVEAFREVAGPQDPEIARVLRPHSLRAKFGFDKVGPH